MTHMPNDQPAPAAATSGRSGDEVKVKVFYTFQGTEATCLCSLLTRIHLTDSPYVQVSLKDCLAVVCASSPDMLLYPDADCAVYSANFQETGSAPSPGQVIWEGHGLLSWIMSTSTNDALLVCGKLNRDNDEVSIEVNFQLHPTHRISRDDYYHMLMRRRVVHHAPQPLGAVHPTDTSAPSHVLHTRHSGGPHGHPGSLYAPTAPPIAASSHEMVPAPPPHQDSFAHVLPPITQLPSHQDAHQDDTGFRRHQQSTSAGVSLPPPSALLGLPHNPQEGSLYNPPPPPPAAPSLQAALQTPTPRVSVGRRKKRDTKPPNANDVRTFVEVEKDSNGNYRLPVEIDSWTVLNLGTVVYDRPAFHNQRYIYPVGYKVKKSMVDPRSDTQYTCEILDGGQEPIFKLEADDNLGEIYTGPTPTTVWTIAVRRAFAIRNMDYGHNPVGPDFFGLRKNTIAKMIQDLPNADKCVNYTWQTFKIGSTSRSSRDKALRSEESPTQQSPS